MNALLYMLAALLSVSFGVRSLAGGRADPIRRDFAVLAFLAAGALAAFSMYLVPGFTDAIYLHTALGLLVPPALYRFLDRVLPPEPGRVANPARAARTMRLALLGSAIYLAVDGLVVRGAPAATAPQVVAGIAVFAGWCASLWRLRRAARRAASRAERIRLRYLVSFLAAAALTMAAEQVARAFAPAVDPGPLGLLRRSFTLQGAVPPLGAVAGVLLLGFLLQVVEESRLVDLHEVFSRLFTLTVGALLLVMVDGLVAALAGGLAARPVHTGFQVLLASVLFLALYRPFHDRLDGLAGEWFNRPGRRLELALTEIAAAMPTVLTLEDLAREVLDRLYACGRVSTAALYVLDEDGGLFRQVARRGGAPATVMPEVAAPALTEGSVADRQQALGHLRRGGGPAAEEALALLDAVGADLVLPIPTAAGVSGLLALASSDQADGFSREETATLGRLAGRIGVVLDNLRAVQAMAERRRLAALGTMAAGLAHEIRNPLAGIKGAAQYLVGGAATPEEEAEFLGIIVQETERLDRVVARFLDYARPLVPALAAVDPVQAARDVLDLVAADPAAAGVDLHLDVEGEPPELRADPDGLRQVLLNLVRNAVHAGARTVRVVVAAGRAGRGPTRSGVEIRVVDDGEGIAPADLERLFVPFFTTRPGGTGLGLPLSRRVVEAHGGELAVRSQPGRGTTFTVRLPVEPPPGLPAPPEPASRGAG